MTTYYDILEVSENASEEVIKASYRALMRKYHPDVYKGDKDFATEQVKIINEAYEVLSDPQKRALYDYHLRSRQESNGSSNGYQSRANHQDRNEQNRYEKSSYGSNDTTYDNNKEEKREGNNASSHYGRNDETESRSADSNDSSKRNPPSEDDDHTEKKSSAGKAIIVLMLILMGVVGFMAFYNHSQNKQWEEAIEAFQSNKEDIMGQIFIPYPTEGIYLYHAGAVLSEGEDESYDKEKEFSDLARKDPRKYLNLYGERMLEKEDGGYYESYMDYLNDSDPAALTEYISNDFKNWHTCTTRGTKAVYGWYGIQVEENTYYVEFRYDNENTDMEDGYDYYAFEVTLPTKGGRGDVNTIIGDSKLEEKYDEYLSYAW